MKTSKIAVLVLTLAVFLFILLPSLSWAAEDGAAIFKAKCAMCHGPDGAGKGAAKSLISDEAKKLSDDDIAKVVTTNPKHGAVKSLTPDQIKAVTGYVRDLQKK